MMSTVRGRRERRTVVRGGHHGGQVVRNPITKEITPSLDWTEDSNGYYLLVDLPDFKKEEVKVEVDRSGILTISGETFTSDNKCILNFKQTFTLPKDSDIEKISAEFDDEILYVSVPKRVIEMNDETNNTTGDHHHDNKNLNDIRDQYVSGKNGITHHNDNDNENSDKSHKKENEEKKSCDDGDENEHEFGGKEPREMMNSHGYNGENAGEFRRKEEKNSRIDSFGEELLEKWGRESGQLEKAVKMIKDNKGIVVTALLAFSLGVFVSRKFGGVRST